MSNNLGTGSGGGSASSYDDKDNVSPLPDFNASRIQLSTVAPAFGISSSSLRSPSSTTHHRQPDYLDYDQKGRGIVSTMFTNSGISYMLGVTIGGFYGLREGLAKTPSSRWKVKLNSVLNHCGRHGSTLGNMMGSTAILYSLYEGLADTVRKNCFLVWCGFGLSALPLGKGSPDMKLFALIPDHHNILTFDHLPNFTNTMQFPIQQ